MNMSNDDLISRREATTIPILPIEHRKYQTMNLDDVYDLGWLDCQNCIEKLLPAQPELIEQAAYVRGFEQGRIQGKIDAQQEIIKCEKCEHYTALTGICEVRGKGLRLIRRPDDFCSRGARREE